MSATEIYKQMIGSLIGNYKILEKLDRSEPTAIYKAVDLSLNRQLLIKVLAREFFVQTETAKRFRREAAVLARLAHPSIPTLHALTEIDGELFMIAEFTEGETLDRIVRHRKIPFEQVASIGTQILECFEYAHKAGVFHGGLQMSDVVIGDAGNVKILNFGAAQTDDAADIATKVKIDVRAIAALIYEMLAGKNFFDREKELHAAETASVESLMSSRLVNCDSPEKIGAALGEVLRPKTIVPFESVGALREALSVAGFDLFGGKAVNPSAESGNVKQTAETQLPIIAGQAAEEKNLTVFSISFSEKQSKRAAVEFGENAAPSNDLTVQSHLDLAPQKSKSKRYKIAGAAVLIVLVSHFLWQFTFIQYESLREAETSSEIIKPIKSNVEIKTNAAVQALTEQPTVKVADDFDDEDAEEAKPIKAMKIIPNKRQFENKSAPKNKIARETKAERLRRAEKLLTGF